MVGVRSEALDKFREKLDRELKSGLVTVVLLAGIERTGPVYGYALLRDIQEASAGRLHFKEGTAYPLLQNLEKAGLVATFWGDGDAGPPRKYYEITTLGRSALKQALTDWAQLRDSVDGVFDTLGRKKA